MTDTRSSPTFSAASSEVGGRSRRASSELPVPVLAYARRGAQVEGLVQISDTRAPGQHVADPGSSGIVGAPYQDRWTSQTDLPVGRRAAGRCHGVR
jgi:hypothetical protein